jgi:prevent-host-death family protein
MKRKVNALEARRRLGELLEGVYYRGDEVIIERAGRPMAAVIPMARYESLERTRDRLFQLVEENWAKNKDVSYEEIERDVAEAIRGVRGERGKAG